LLQNADFFSPFLTDGGKKARRMHLYFLITTTFVPIHSILLAPGTSPFPRLPRSRNGGIEKGEDSSHIVPPTERVLRIARPVIWTV
jgi:hypothetical protein